MIHMYERNRILRKQLRLYSILIVIFVAVCILQTIFLNKVLVELNNSRAQTEQALAIADESKHIAIQAIKELEMYKTRVECSSTPEKICSQHHLTVTATAYCPCELCCGIYSAEHSSHVGTTFVQKTATGTIPQQGRTIAVDPSVIPLGSKVKIGDTVYTAEDTGGAIKGNRIDIFFESHKEALIWGRQTVEVIVYEDQEL